MTKAERDPGIRLGTGLISLLGITRTGFAENYARFELDLQPHHLNHMGIPHGGLYATILDTALGTAGNWDGSPDSIRPSITLNLNVSYVGQPKGTHLVCEARRVDGGKSIYFAEGEVSDDTGIVLARATGTFKSVKPR
ncbi:PaaI family thioesterase [Chachezhania sediminis]|uniref:PaaI family thioesterase n=1 Tax=Chachezhania sediminis TaxID=2599291 RepID=UPI00131C5C8D|nr:PaaI family thioesterase [Chachezhania sediminis]